MMHFIPQGEKEDKDNKSLRIVGDRVITNKSERKVQNIFEWITAFMRYMKIYLQKQKSKLFQMLEYAEDIRFAAAKCSEYVWRVYNEQFHVIMDSSPNTRWDSINQRLWLLYITPSTMTASYSGNSDGNKSCFHRKGPNKNAAGGKICYAFNKGRCHRGKKCLYEHTCECGEYRHNKNNCPKNKK